VARWGCHRVSGDRVRGDFDDGNQIENISAASVSVADSFAHTDWLAFPLRGLLQADSSGLEPRWAPVGAMELGRFFEGGFGFTSSSSRPPNLPALDPSGR